MMFSSCDPLVLSTRASAASPPGIIGSRSYGRSYLPSLCMRSSHIARLKTRACFTDTSDASALSPASIGKHCHFTGSPCCANLMWSDIEVWTWDGLVTCYVGNGDG